MSRFNQRRFNQTRRRVLKQTRLVSFLIESLCPFRYATHLPNEYEFFLTNDDKYVVSQTKRHLESETCSHLLLISFHEINSNQIKSNHISSNQIWSHRIASNKKFAWNLARERRTDIVGSSCCNDMILISQGSNSRPNARREIDRVCSSRKTMTNRSSSSSH